MKGMAILKAPECINNKATINMRHPRRMNDSIINSRGPCCAEQLQQIKRAHVSMQLQSSQAKERKIISRGMN